ncbi:MAG: DNA polymerase III subunit delta [Candidatus Eisenbacteria bacterium]
MNLEGYVKKLAAGEWDPPRAVVYGKESLGVGETASKILAAVERGGANRITLDGKKLDAGALGDELAQMPLFAERRVVFVDGAGSKDEMNDLVERVENEPDLFLLVRHYGETDKRHRWYKKCSAGGAAFEFPEPKQRDMPKRIREVARSLDVDLPEASALALAALVGLNLLTARNELRKLRLFVSPRTSVTPEDVEAVVGRSRDTLIYEITRAVAGDDPSRSFADLKDLLRQGVSAGAILTLLAREVRFLLQAKILLREDRGIRTASRAYESLTPYLRDRLPREVKDRFGKGRSNLVTQNPYVVFLHLKEAPKYEGAALAGLLAAFSRADRAVKRGAGSPETVLYATVAAAASKGRRP